MPAGEWASVNAREIQTALRKLDGELAKRTRRVMAEESRKVRDEVRGDWKRGPNVGGHSFRAVTSGTRGLIPTLTLNRDYRPYVGWLVFGGTRRRRYRDGSVRVDRRRRVVPKDGLWFYPGVKRARKRVQTRVQAVLEQAIRDAGLG